MNALEKVVDLLMAISLMLLVPLLYYGSGKSVSQSVLAGQAGEAFLKRVSTAGEITQPVRKELERELELYGCEYYEIVRIRTLYEPGGDGRGVTEKEYVADKEALYKQIAEDGGCKLQNGDRLWLTLYLNEVPAIYYTTVRSGETDT